MGAYDDVRIDDLARLARSQQSPDTGGVNPVEGDDVRGGLANETGAKNLAFWLPERLGERGGRDRDPRTGFQGTRNNHEDPSIPVIKVR
jgi:hypothetical protein